MMILKGRHRMNVTSDLFPNLTHQAPIASAIIEAALKSADPQIAVENYLLTLQKEIDFPSFQNVGLVSIGKAAVPMARAAILSMAGRIKSGVVVSKTLPEKIDIPLPGIRILKGNHPVPGADSIQAGKEVIRYVEGFGEKDAIIFLISGGASALVTQPADPIKLDDLIKVTTLLLECGASIEEINAIRKHLDTVKGGRLAVSASPAVCITLALSDVPGNRLDVIASGPTVTDTSTYTDALSVIEKYRLPENVPEAVLTYLSNGARGLIAETPKPGNPVFNGNKAYIIGSVEQAMQAAKISACEKGYETEIFTPLITGEAREQGIRLGGFLREQALHRKPGDPHRCWVAGGETTVTLTGNGSGGRNQELALAAVNELAGITEAALITFATDGEDGRSPAAGAVVTGDTRQMALNLRMDPAEYMANHDSFTFFKALKGAIITGSTGTNVNDLVLLMLD
jgi:glycerate 2-kinase